jgi:hypothetical protein
VGGLHLAIAIYFNSIVDRTISDCSLLVQTPGDPASVTTYSLQDLNDLGLLGLQKGINIPAKTVSARQLRERSLVGLMVVSLFCVQKGISRFA